MGAYTIESVGISMLVRSEEKYLHAATVPGGAIAENAWERYILVNNSDGTVSLRDKHMGKYVSVQGGTPYLKASAERVGVNEKFYLFVLSGKTGHYALKSFANGKYVTVEPCEIDGARIDNVLCANRDKVTDNFQLFKIKRVGDAPIEEPVKMDTIVTFTGTNTSYANVSFAAPEWMENTASDQVTAKITYTDKSAYGGIKTVAMKISDGGQRAICEIFTGSGQDPTAYMITYTLLDGTEKTISGIYNPNGVKTEGIGNGSALDGNFVNGVYTWKSRLTGKYTKVEEDGKGPLSLTADEIKDSDYNVRFILVNNGDKTFSLRVVSPEAQYKYVSIQPDGRLIANQNKPGVNEKFMVEYAGDNGFYNIKTLPEGNGKGKYLYADGSKLDLMIKEQGGFNGLKADFFLQWIGYTDKLGPIIPDEPDIPNDNPVANMKYYTETSAISNFTSPHWTGASEEKVTLRYRVNDGVVTTVAMNKSGLDASFIVEGLKHKDKVTYWFDYTYVDGQLRQNTTANYVYIHETKYGNPIGVTGTNENVDLGESLEVKSNQIAYLVPPECIGVFNGETLIGKNPLTAAEFVKLMAYRDNTTTYPDFELVSFTKTLEDLGENKKLGDYRTPGTDGYRTIFVQTTNGTMVYFYVDFNSDNTSKYFRDYYQKHQAVLEQYMSEYVSKIELNGYFTRLTADGNLMHGGSGGISLKSNEGHGYQLSGAEKSALKNEEEGYQKRYKALCSKLILNYSDLSMTEKQNNVFDNLIRYGYTTPGDTEPSAFAGIPNNTVPITYNAGDGTIKAMVVNNDGQGVFRYNASNDPAGRVCLIIATGDVVLEQNFEGTVIARGNVTIANNSVNAVAGNRESLLRVLQTKVDPDDEHSKTLIEKFFRNGDGYTLDGSGEIETHYASYADMVTYENWMKR